MNFSWLCIFKGLMRKLKIRPFMLNYYKRYQNRRDPRA